MKYADLCGRTVLVTGAGHRLGIGAALCRAFAAQECRVFFTYCKTFDQPIYRNEENDVAALAEELRAVGTTVEYMDIDLAIAENAEVLLDRVQRVFGDPSILVNNAAYSTRDGFERLDAKKLDAHYNVNVRATALLSVGFARRFLEGTGGRIINLTSGQDLGPMPGELAYAASKGAVTAFTRSLAKEVAHKGITVNAVDPGPTDTGWMSEDIKVHLTAENGFGRIGLPEDAARLILFLASAAGEWISGEVMHSRGI